MQRQLLFHFMSILFCTVVRYVKYFVRTVEEIFFNGIFFLFKNLITVKLFYCLGI